MNLRDHLISLISLLLVISGTILKAASLVAIALGVLWLIGWGFPYVVDKLGLPCDTVYACLKSIGASMEVIQNLH